MTKIDGKIYKITYPDLPYYYVGQTRMTLKERLYCHIRDALRYIRKDKFHNWVQELPDPFDLEIIEIGLASNQDDLDNLEKYYIDLSDPYCLNTESGGLRPGNDGYGACKLTQKQANYLRDLYHSPDYRWHGPSLCEEYQVSLQTLRRIILNRTYIDGNYSPPDKYCHNETYDRQEQAREAIKGAHVRNADLAFQVRVFASKNKHLSIAKISINFPVSRKTCGNWLNNAYNRDDRWDPETWDFID